MFLLSGNCVIFCLIPYCYSSCCARCCCASMQCMIYARGTRALRTRLMLLEPLILLLNLYFLTLLCLFNQRCTNRCWCTKVCVVGPYVTNSTSGNSWYTWIHLCLRWYWYAFVEEVAVLRAETIATLLRSLHGKWWPLEKKISWWPTWSSLACSCSLRVCSLG